MTLVIDPDQWVRERISHAQRRLQKLLRSASEPAPRALQGMGAVTDREGWLRMRAAMLEQLLTTQPLNRGTWQALDVNASRLHGTYELGGVQFALQVPSRVQALQELLQPDLPWAEDHFQERVGGLPLNPAPSEAWWPYAVRGNSDHKADSKFDHTYPERYWPKLANGGQFPHRLDGSPEEPRWGIRFPYGDLGDVANALAENPRTRQAVLTVWFPEDQWAASHGKRVPCSLSYHFISDELGQLDVYYTIRSCDYYRHMTNDAYMTARLLQWMADEVNMAPGKMVMAIHNLHLFVGDREKANP